MNGLDVLILIVLVTTHSKIERELVPRFHRPILRLGEKSEEMEKRGDLIMIIEPDQSKAPIMKWVFEELALGRFNTEQVWKQAVRKGLKCSKNNFWLAIRNPVYCGQILIPEFEGDKAQRVKIALYKTNRRA